MGLPIKTRPRNDFRVGCGDTRGTSGASREKAMGKIAYGATGVWRGNDTSGGRRALAATLVALLVWLMSAATAFADERSDIFGGGAGPVFAWGTHGFTAGWEVSATLGSPLLRVAVGGDYLRGASGLGFAHYLAYEPGLAVGATAGAAVFDAGVSPYLGGWAGVAVPSGNLRTIPIAETDYSRLAGVLISLAIGYRWFGDEHQFYVTPKITYYEFPNPNS
jgi:hypothetical protein